LLRIKIFKNLRVYKKFIKRVLDYILAILAFPFWIIILIIFGTLIYLEDKGPIFYNSFRLGRDGKIFRMYKFRSMIVNAPDIRNMDGSTFNSENDSRLTRIGRFIRRTSIDETPQIINVIKGDMSIIGPRPDLPEHFELYSDKEIEKLKTRPGITGYNQAYFRNKLNWKKRIQNDIYYINHASLFLDIKIFIKTIITLLKNENVFISTNSGKTGDEDSNCY